MSSSIPHLSVIEAARVADERKSLKKLKYRSKLGQKLNDYYSTSSCARFATFARSSLRSLCHRALQLILCVVE